MSSATIETLESRTLMADTLGSLSAQVTVDVTSIKVSVTALAKTAAHDQRVVTTDLRHTTSANAALTKSLAGDYKAATANLRLMEKMAIVIGKDTKKAAALAHVAQAHSSTKTLAKLNAALGKLSTDDNQFVSANVVNAFYTITSAPGTDLVQIGSSNSTNTRLSADLAGVEADASDLTNTPYTKFNAMVTDVSAFATFVINNISGAVF